MKSMALPKNFAVAAGMFSAVMIAEMAVASTIETAVDTSGLSGFIDLSYGDHTITSGLGDLVEVDSYRFQGTAGDSVRTVISSLAGGLDPEIA